MRIFAHRINTIEDLSKVNKDYGVELDLRSNGDYIYIHHDAFVKGIEFEKWLEHYEHSGLILNTKCEGLEERLLEILRSKGIGDYFFLDLSLPFLVKLARNGVRQIAVRYSEYEPMEFVMKFKGLVDWVWIDCFNGKPISNDDMKMLKSYFKVCVVSPELQGYDLERIASFKAEWEGISIDAVCTKKPDLWIASN